MTLAQLNGILQANQLKTKLIYAADIDMKQFRSLTQKNLSNPLDLVLVNYRRLALNQLGGGHISPVAAYHQKSDRFSNGAKAPASLKGTLHSEGVLCRFKSGNPTGLINPVENPKGKPLPNALHRFLILDVAAYKYPPTWVKTQELWNGINSIDKTSNHSRGLIMVQG